MKTRILIIVMIGVFASSIVVGQDSKPTSRQIKRTERKMQKENEKEERKSLKEFKPAYAAFIMAYADYEKKSFPLADSTAKEQFKWFKYAIDSAYPKLIVLKKGNNALIGLNDFLMGLAKFMNTETMEVFDREADKMVVISDRKEQEKVFRVWFLNLHGIVKYL